MSITEFFKWMGDNGVRLVLIVAAVVLALVVLRAVLSRPKKRKAPARGGRAGGKSSRLAQLYAQRDALEKKLDRLDARYDRMNHRVWGAGTDPNERLRVSDDADALHKRLARLNDEIEVLEMGGSVAGKR